MKNEQLQEVKSSGVLLILGLVGLSMAIVATPWNRQFQDSRVEVALQKAEIVGYQVVQIYREASNSSLSSDKKTRVPASVAPTESGFPVDLRSTGTMGTDPWGAPYRYRILSVDKSGKVRIVVWSTGPNQKAETAKLDDEDATISGQPNYAGDDIGVLLSMTHN